MQNSRFVCAVGLSSLMACASDEPTDKGPLEVTLRIQGEPALVVAREDGAEQWVTLERDDDGAFRFEVFGPYRITVGCRDRLRIDQHARTPDDDPEVEVDCRSSAIDASITTTMVQPGKVDVDYHSVSSAEPDWEVNMAARSGPQTVIARDEQHIAVFRDLDVQGEFALPSIDLVAQGEPLVRGALTATNAEPDETVLSLVWLFVENNASLFITSDLDDVQFAPDALIEDGEEQVIELRATRDDGTERYASSPRAGTASLTLPEPIKNPAFSRSGLDRTATWESAPGDEVTLFVHGTIDGESWSHSLAMSAAYAGTRGNSATLDLASIPQVPVELLPSSAEQTTIVFVFNEEGGVSYIEHTPGLQALTSGPGVAPRLRPHR